MTIGLIGCEPGIGVTHLAIALSNFCGSKLRKRTAYLEFHNRPEIKHLVSDSGLPCKELSAKGPAGFQIHDVNYYTGVKKEVFPALLNCGYQYLFLDLGSLGEADMQEFLRCDRKLVIGSLAPWKIETYQNFMQSMNHITNLGEGFYYLTRTESPKRTHEIYQAFHNRMHLVPYIQDPFRIQKEYFSVLQEFLN